MRAWNQASPSSGGAIGFSYWPVRSARSFAHGHSGWEMYWTAWLAFSGFSARKLRNYFLLNPEETGERHFKLILSQTDKESLTAIVGGAEQPKESSLRVTQNHQLFEELIAGCKGDVAALCKGLAKLVVVDIALNREQDNPQLIFESMNSTGRELSQADLIRNFILMGLGYRNAG